MVRKWGKNGLRGMMRFGECWTNERKENGMGSQRERERGRERRNGGERKDKKGEKKDGKRIESPRIKERTQKWIGE